MASDDRNREDRAFAMLIAPADKAVMPEDRAAGLKTRILAAAVATRAPEDNVVPIAMASRNSDQRSETGLVTRRQNKAGRRWQMATAAALAASLVIGVAAGAVVSGGVLEAGVSQLAGNVLGVEAPGDGELLAGLMGDTSEGLF